MELEQCTDIGRQTQAQANDSKVFISATKKKKIQTCLQYILQNVLNMKKVFGQGIKKTSSSAGILNRLLFGRPGPGI